jgi:hypothetical protein
MKTKRARLRLSLLGAAMIGLFAVLTSPGLSCGSDSGNGPSSVCDCCVADPAQRCVSVLACADDSQCPAGTTCTTVSSACVSDWKSRVPQAFAACGETVALNDAGTGQKWCGAIRGGPSNSSVLASGFGVEELQLTKTSASEGTAVLHWTPPMGAQVVACALFGCAPDVGPGPARMDLSENSLPEIRNYDRCVLLSAQIEPAVGSFPLEGTPAFSSRAVDAGADDPACGEHHVFPRDPLITTLVAGCWAYGDATILQASPLVDIDPGELPANNGIVTTSCKDANEQPASEGLSCLLPPEALFPEEKGTRVFGTCHSGSCERRCISEEDCVANAPGSSGQGTAGSGGTSAASGGGVDCAAAAAWSCVQLGQGHYLGVCEKQPITGAGGAPP